jgi:PadR family transcriptional regulator PadR
VSGPEPDRRSQWLRGVLDLCVLALLASGESYGYELGQSLERAGLGAIPGGTLYPVLLRLERGGLVTSAWRTGGAGPARKYYALTDEGRRLLRQGGTHWLQLADRVNDLLRRGGIQ